MVRGQLNPYIRFVYCFFFIQTIQYQRNFLYIHSRPTKKNILTRKWFFPICQKLAKNIVPLQIFFWHLSSNHSVGSKESSYKIWYRHPKVLNMTLTNPVTTLLICEMWSFLFTQCKVRSTENLNVNNHFLIFGFWVPWKCTI